MAAASSTGSDVPAERAAAAVNDLAKARDGAVRLGAFLLQLDHESAPWMQMEIDGVLTSLTSAMSALDVTDAAAVGRRSPAAGSDGGARPQQSVSSSRNRRRLTSSGRSRSQRPSEQKVTATLDDGHVWRKYGQKDIQDSPHPRSYYKCTHRSDQGCNARRQVQRCETDTSMYVVTYYGEHTCRDLSTVPLIDQQVAHSEPDGRANNLIISFGAGGSGNAAAAAGNGVVSSSQYLAMCGSAGAAADQLSTSWCASDDVFSSSAGSFMQVDQQLMIGAVVGSAGVTSEAAPDRGMFGGVASGGGGGTACFPPSPNSLSFVVGSLGSIGGGGDDDDMFRLDDP